MSAFRIPELAALVCQYSDYETCLRVLYLCRTSFLAAIPFVWHTVDGADKLLTLIPDTVCKEKRDAVSFIDIAAAPNFHRYQLYAPHVRCLDVYGKKQKYFELNGWLKMITEFSASFRLPRLETLKIRTLDNAGVKDHLYWISAFVNNSTHEVAILPGRPRSGKLPLVSTQTASVILQTVLDRAPAIRRLSFYPCATQRADRPNEKESCLLCFLHKHPFTEILGSFQNLSKLATTAAIINTLGLQKLGRLPHLQGLCVSNNGDTLVDFDHGLDDTYFPVLSSLTLRFMVPSEAEVILKVAPLVRRLTSLAIRFCSDEIQLDAENEDEDEGTWTATHLLSHLEHSSRLEDLTIDFDMSKRREEILEIWDFSLITNRLAMLPIKKLTLQSVKLALENFTEEGFDGSMWPWLRHLYIPDQDASGEALLALSGVPRLLFLNVKLHLTGIDAQTAAEGFVGRSLFMIEASKGSTIDADSDNLEQQVGFLLTLWPNIMRITWPEGSTAIEKMYVGCLNKHLKLTRQVRNIGQGDVSME